MTNNTLYGVIILILIIIIYYYLYGKSEVVKILTRDDIKNISQSSSAYGGAYPASNLIDGNLNNFNHTEAGSNEWVLVELNQIRKIKDIKIINRRDCCQNRIVGAVLTVLDDKMNVVYSSTLSNVAAEYEFKEINKNGKYIKISKNGHEFINLAEIIISAV